MMIKIDDVDLWIIASMYDLNDNEIITTTQLAHKLFKSIGVYELRKHDNFIRSRLKKIASYGIIEISNEDVKYQIDKDKVHFSRLKRSIPKINQQCCFLNINKKWHIYPFG